MKKKTQLKKDILLFIKSIGNFHVEMRNNAQKIKGLKSRKDYKVLWELNFHTDPRFA